MVIEDLNEHRRQALQAWAHPLSRPMRDLCDEVELLRRQLAALVADNNRLRANAVNLRLADNTCGDGSDKEDKPGCEQGIDADVRRIRRGECAYPRNEFV